MNERRLRRALQETRAPGEDAAARRAWEVARAAHAERPVPRRLPRVRPVVVLLAGVLLLAVLLTPSGAAVGGHVFRALTPDALVTVKRATLPVPLLDRLPAAGRILAVAPRGTYVVDADGTRRRLGTWRDASWSPHGRNVAVRSAHVLAAVDPVSGVRRWRLAHADVVGPARWSPGDGFRVAYVAGGALRVANGDGSGDGVLQRGAASVPPAWRPHGTGRVLAYVRRDGAVVAVDVDRAPTRAVLWSAPTAAAPVALAWTGDGRLLAVLTGRELRLLRARDGAVVTSLRLPPGQRGAVLAAAPRGSGLAVAATTATRPTSRLWLLDASTPRLGPVRLSGSGRFTSLAWSPDARLVAVAWPFTDAWVFVPRARGAARVSFGGMARQVGAGSFPQIAGWAPGPG